MWIRSKISQPIRPWYHSMLHCFGPLQGPWIDIPQSASVTLARLCVTGSLINLVQLVSHAEGNGPSVPHRDQRKFTQNGWDWYNVYHLLVLLALIEHGPVGSVQPTWRSLCKLCPLCKLCKLCILLVLCNLRNLAAFCPYIPPTRRRMHIHAVCCHCRPWRHMKRATGLCRTTLCPFSAERCPKVFQEVV